jgi:hypothetical protein
MRHTLISKAAGFGVGALALVAFARSASAQQAIIMEVGGGSGGYLSSFQAPSYEIEDVNQALGPDYVPGGKAMGQPKIGEATAVFNISQAGSLLAWVASAWEGRNPPLDTAVSLVDQNYNIRRGIDMLRSVITGIEFSALKASDGKKHFEVTARFQPEEVKYIGGGNGKPTPMPPVASPDSVVTNFSVTIPGLRNEWITSIGLPKITPKIAKESHGKFRLPLLNYASVEFGTVTIGISAEGFEAARSMAVRILQDGKCEAGELLEILVDMKDQSLKKVLGTFTLVGCGLKKFDWAPKLEGGKEGLAAATMEFMVEDFRYAVSHK